MGRVDLLFEEQGIVQRENTGFHERKIKDIDIMEEKKGYKVTIMENLK